MNLDRISFRNQRGMAMFVAIMMLGLGSGFALLAWQVSSTELEISRFTVSEETAYVLAESGIDKVISWASNPASSPNAAFFENLPTTSCSNNVNNPDYVVPSAYLTDPDVGPFKALSEMGQITELYFYRAKSGLCTVGVLAEGATGGKKRIEVELARNPLVPLGAGIQGRGNPATPSPVWLHWGNIRYTGSANLGENTAKVPRKVPGFIPDGFGSPYAHDEASYDLNEDQLLEVLVEGSVSPPPDGTRPNVKEGQNVQLDVPDEPDVIKRFIKENGEAYIVSEIPGMLKDHQGNAKSFHELFGPENPGLPPKLHLAWIDTDEDSSSAPLVIEGGPYRGYFYFPEGMDVQINNWDNSQLIDEANVKPPDGGGGSLGPVVLSGLNLVGFFYVQGEAEVQQAFSTYGALYAEEGFSGPAAGDLELWYNPAFSEGRYAGIRPVTPLPGTWKTPPAVM